MVDRLLKNQLSIYVFLFFRHSPLTRQPYPSATDVLVAGLLELELERDPDDFYKNASYMNPDQ